MLSQSLGDFFLSLPFEFLHLSFNTLFCLIHRCRLVQFVPNAFVALQLGFQRGDALATAGMATLWTNALPIAAGTMLFGESVPSGMRGVARVAAFVCVVLGAALLARPEAAVLGRPEPLTD